MNPSQTQQIQDTFTRAAAEHVGRVEAACAEASRLESKGAEQARVVIDECARLARESMSYSLQLSEQWRKVAIEATRRTFEMMTPKVLAMHHGPSQRETVFRDGTAQLYRFERPRAAKGAGRAPVLLVPSLINRWYVLDLRRGSSLVEALAAAGHDVYCLDWGVPEDEDRYLGWDDLQRRLGRAVRKARRISGAASIGLLGYSMGATVAGIYAAQHPAEVAAFVNLAGPFDFSKVGVMGAMTCPAWFDAGAVAAAGNVSALQIYAGFIALRPTGPLAHLASQLDHARDARSHEVFDAMDAWSKDTIPFPAAIYATYIRELYQQNLLIKGEHYVEGARVDLGAFRAPLLTIATERDTICPLSAARGLHDRCASIEKELLVVPGGHVSAVAGARSKETLYPSVCRFFGEKLAALPSLAGTGGRRSGPPLGRARGRSTRRVTGVALAVLGRRGGRRSGSAALCPGRSVDLFHHLLGLQA